MFPVHDVRLDDIRGQMIRVMGCPSLLGHCGRNSHASEMSNDIGYRRHRGQCHRDGAE